MAWKEIVLDAAPLLDASYVLPTGDVETGAAAPVFYTIPEVLAEIKDEQSIQRLAQLRAVHDLTVQQPTKEAVDLVIQFAKRSGDLQVLSRADLRLVALAVSRMQANHIHLRTSPFQAITHEGVQQKPNRKVKQQQQSSNKTQNERQKEGESTAALGAETEEDEDGEETLIEAVQALQVTESEEASGQISRPASPSPTTMTSTKSTNEEDGEDGFVKVSHRKLKPRFRPRQMKAEEGWITPQNIDEMKRKHASIQTTPHLENGTDNLAPSALPTATKNHAAVAVMTGDFAMQNVLLQVGAFLLAHDGRRITQVRQHVLRCHACTR